MRGTDRIGRWLASDLAIALWVFLLPAYQLIDANPYFKFKYGFDERLLGWIVVLFALLPFSCLAIISAVASWRGDSRLHRIPLIVFALLFVSHSYSTTLHAQSALLRWSALVSMLALAAWLLLRRPRGFATLIAMASILLLPYLGFQTIRHWWKMPRPPAPSASTVEALHAPGDIFLILLDGSVITSDHLDAENYPDSDLLPNFARFVRSDAHWFHEAVSNGPETSISLPSMISGRLHPNRRNNYLANEENLFSILSARFPTSAYLFTRGCFCYEENFALCHPFRPQDHAEPLRVLAESLAFISSFRLAPLSFEIGRLNEDAYDRASFVEDLLARVREPADSPRFFAIQLFDRSDEDLVEFDRFFGDLRSALQARGRYEDATIVVISDHGLNREPSGFEYGLHARQTRRLYRVPFALKPPGVGGGSKHDYVAQGIDLLPTLLALLLPDPEVRSYGFDGVDLLRERPERPHYIGLRDPHRVYRFGDGPEDDPGLIPVAIEEIQGH